MQSIEEVSEFLGLIIENENFKCPIFLCMIISMGLRDLPSAEIGSKYRFMYRIAEFANIINIVTP